MLAELAAENPIIQNTYSEASAVLGYDLWDLVQNGPEADLNQTDRTQPALLVSGVALWRLWLEKGGAKPAMMAGHS
jgi:[acyl-carrier-protein] S-malonyltransferase